MRSVVFTKFGAPAEVLVLTESPKPEPKAGEVRIQMKMSPIHNHDTAIVAGTYGFRPVLPAIPGTEAVGLIDALGEGVEGLAVGQRVAVGGASATWAGYFTALAAKVVPLPDSIEDDTACQLIAMPLSAWMLLEDLQLKKGEWMVQNAANGAVGKTVASLARARGINVVNLVRSEAGVAELEALGIDHGISTEHEGWEERVREVTIGAPVLRGVDSIGGQAANEIMNCLASGGQMLCFGALSGQPLSIDAGNLIFKQTTVKGFWGAKRAETTPPAELRRAVGELVGLAANGELTLPVTAHFDLAQISDAVAAHHTSGRSGKVAITA
jgi:NADPH:quinone reductase-like Zn-dependent oxidoreductase